MKKIIEQKISTYVILGLLCAIVPFITIVVLAILTGDGETGLSYCFILSTITVHFVFAAIFLKVKRILKYTLPLITAAISIFGTNFLASLSSYYVRLDDTYGYWDMVLIHFLIATATWIITYRILRQFCTCGANIAVKAQS